MSAFTGKRVVISTDNSWGEIEYRIAADGRSTVTKDKVAWEQAVQQLRNLGAIIVDNDAIRAEQETAKAEMLKRMGK